jgi:hypothetical protein
MTMLGPYDNQIIFRDRGVAEPVVAELVKAERVEVFAQDFRFGRMLGIKDDTTGEAALRELIGLNELGAAINGAQTFFDGMGRRVSDDSDIPAGYTYLGQFLAHEVSRDPRLVVPTEAVDVEALPQMRSPALDLDSLYTREGPATALPGMFEDNGVRMKVGDTTPAHFWGKVVPHDLPRHAPGTPEHREALIGDPRNDENLVTAQTLVALIHFHNAVARWMNDGPDAPATFEKVRGVVVRHFQWVVLHDFLPRVIDADAIRRVLAYVRAHGGQPEFFRPLPGGEIYTPVEFSGAAFRFGHSMVRDSYQWNFFRKSGSILGAARPKDLFELTGFSGNVGGQDSLPSDWVINWRRFYDFPGSPVVSNKAKKIDTSFNFRLEDVAAYPHGGNPQPLTTRNLLRGFAYRLPSGQEAARVLGEEELPEAEVVSGPHEKVLREHGYHRRTPLWYYILKEAERRGRGNRLGPVGSRIVAEVFVGLILNSGFSILDPADPARDWQPVLPALGPAGFDMPSLLAFANVVNPVGED